MPYGMKNSWATFQRMVNKVVDGLHGCDAYNDDLIIYTDSWLQSVFEWLSRANLTVNLNKSKFGNAEVTFLGHIVGNGQVKPVDANIRALLSYPVPTNKQQLMRFLGMAGYYRCFCQNFSLIVAPLTNLLMKWQDYQWTERCQTAFQSMMTMLSSKCASFSATVLPNGGC